MRIFHVCPMRSLTVLGIAGCWITNIGAHMLVRRLFVFLWLGIWFSAALTQPFSARKIWTEPEAIRFDDTVKVYIDLKACRQGKNLREADSVYFWTFTPADPVNIEQVMGLPEASALNSLMTHEGDGVWSYTLVPTEYFGLDTTAFLEGGWWAQAKVKNAYASKPFEDNYTEYMGISRIRRVDLQPPETFRGISFGQQLTYQLILESHQVLPDPDTSLSIGEVLSIFDAGGFHFPDLLVKRTYHETPFWLYLQVHNPDTVAHLHHLLVGFFGMSWNDVTVYTRDEAGRLDSMYTGNLMPLDRKPIADWRSMLPLSLAAGETKQLFFRMVDYDSHENIPFVKFVAEFDRALMDREEATMKIHSAVMLAILSFAVVFFLVWFFMSRQREQLYLALLWLGFLLSILIPSPLGSFFVINEIYPLITDWYDLALGWLVVSSVTIWGLLAFSSAYLEFRTYAPKVILWVRVLAALPLLLFGFAAVTYWFPGVIPYNPYVWEGAFYFPSTNIRSVISAVAFLFMAVMGVYVARKGFRPAIFYLISFVPLTISATLVSMSNLRMAFKGNAIGLPPDLSMLNYVSMVLALVLFGLAMGYKQRRLQQNHEAAQADLLAARARALEEEARAREQAIQLRERELSLQEERNKQAQMAELDALKNRFFTNITHEFRTPLTVIMGIAEQIQGHEQEKKLIHRNSRHLLRLINQLLDLARLEQGDLPLHMRQADIVAFARFLTESFYSMAEEKGIRLTFYAEAEEIWMDYDEEKLQYVVYNLLSNALKFTGRGGKVILHVKEAEGFLTIRVQDTGRGIAPEELPHIFNRFYQTETAAERGEGSGIGLAYTRELIQLLGGRIEVQSELGKGTTFTCFLPITREAPRQTIARPEWVSPAEARPVTDAPAMPATVDVNRPLLLIVEDNPDLVTYMESILGDFYQLLIARDGQAGIEMALAEIPDLVISDIMMPHKDGYELCATLKQDQRTSHIPVILLTAKATQDDKLQGLTRGADAYLLKPFDKRELRVRVEKLIELRRSLQATYRQGEGAASPEEGSDAENKFLQQLRAYVEAHLSDTDFSIPDLSKALAMSQTQLYRKLKALTGQTPSLFVRSIRLEKGKELLQNSDLTVAEIAYEVGFSDPNYFSKTFHQTYRLPPGAFRKRL